MTILDTILGRKPDPWRYAPAWAIALRDQVGAFIINQEKNQMATAETLARLQDDVRKNTDAAAAAKLALEGFVTTVADLTKQLQDAIAGGDEDAIKAAADAIEANNAALTAAIPATSTAVAANT